MSLKQEAALGASFLAGNAADLAISTHAIRELNSFDYNPIVAELFRSTDTATISLVKMGVTMALIGEYALAMKAGGEYKSVANKAAAVFNVAIWGVVLFNILQAMPH
jgi:hypothetical protein